MLLQVLKMAAVLAAVLALIYGLAWLFRRFNRGGQPGDSALDGWRVLGVKTLGPKRWVYILEVGTKILLVGATDRSLATLMELNDAQDIELLRSAVGRKSGLPSFRDILRRSGG